MKALIIAAGEGSRFGNLTKDEPKPLVRLLGLSLVKRVILTAKEVGINEFIIVIGYLGERVKEKLGDGNRYGVKITYVENREWEKENEVSVLKAKESLKENCIDTGIFLCSPKIFSYIEETVKEGREEFADGIAQAAKNRAYLRFSV